MKEEIIINLDLQQDEGDYAKLAQLKGSLINIKEEQARLNKAYKDGNITVKELASETVRLEANQKKLANAYTETQRKVTGLKSPFENLNESLNANTSAIDMLIPGMGSASAGFINMAKSAMAFIATPIGAVVAGIAAIIGTLTAAIKTNDAIADDFEAVWSSITAIFGEALRTVGMLGGAFTKLFTGDFTGAFNDAADAVGGFGGRLQDSAMNAYALSRALQQLEDDTNKFKLTEQAIKNEIDKLILQSKDRSKTEEERIKLIERAAALEKKLTEENISLIQRAAEAELKGLGDRQKIYKTTNETIQEYGRRLIESGRFGTEEQNKIVSAVRSVDEALNNSIRLQEKLQNQRNALLDKQDEEDRKRREKRAKEQQDYIKESVKAAEEERDRFLKEQQELQDLKDANSTAAFQAEWAERVRIAQEANAEMDMAAQRAFDKEKERRVKSLTFIQGITEGISGILVAGLQSNAEIGKQILKSYLITVARMLKGWLMTKVIGESFATPDSVLSFGVTGAIRAGVMTALIEGAFAGIESFIAGFAQGGVVSGTKIDDRHGKRIKRSNGDNRLVTVKTGEVILNERQQAALGGDDTFRKLGVPGFAMGGVVPSTIQASPDFELMRRLVNALNKQRVAVVIEDVELKMSQRAAIRESATL